MVLSVKNTMTQRLYEHLQPLFDLYLLLQPMAGTFSLAGQATCTNCSAGRYTNHQGQHQCKNCSAGKRSETVGATTFEECVNCIAGQFSDQTGATSCTECHVGKYAMAKGKQQCQECAAGRYNSQVGGSHDNIRATPATSVVGCVNCVPGMYGTQTGQISKAAACRNCPSGKSSTTVGASGLDKCLPCKTGKATNGVGEISCKHCLAGTYADESGLVVCKSCKKGRYSTKAGRDNAPCDDCLIGFYVILSQFYPNSIPILSQFYPWFCLLVLWRFNVFNKSNFCFMLFCLWI